MTDKNTQFEVGDEDSQFDVWEDISWEREHKAARVQKFIDEGADSKVKDSLNGYGILPLFFDDRDACRVLIENGADVKSVDADGWSALDTLLRFDPADWDIDNAVFFLEQGIDVNRKPPKSMLPLAQVVWSEKAFGREGYNEEVDMASILLAYGAKINNNMLKMASERMRFVLTQAEDFRKRGRRIIKPILVKLKKEERAFKKWSKHWKEKVRPLRAAKKSDEDRQKLVLLLDSLNTQPATLLRKKAKEAAVKAWGKENPQKSKYMMRKQRERQEALSLLDTLNKQPPTLIRKAAKETVVRAYRLKNPKER